MSQKEIFGNFYQGEVLDLLFSLCEPLEDVNLTTWSYLIL